MEELELLETIEQEDPGMLFQSWRKLTLTSYWHYIRIVNDFRWVDPWFHGEEIVKFLEQLDRDKEDGCLLLWRGAGKTGLVTQPLPAWWLAKNKFCRVGLANANEQKANRMIRVSASIISSNYLYKLIFPDIRPSSKWGEDGYYLDVHEDDFSLGTKERVDPSLAGYGIRGNLAGSHFNGGFIFDDLLNDETYKSPAMRKRSEDFIREVINVIDPGTPVRGCFTRWTYDDYGEKIESGELSSRRGKFKILKVPVIRKVAGNKDKLSWPLKTWADDHGNVYEAGDTWDSVKNKKATLKSLYWALYHNEPVMGDAVQFDLPKIQFFTKLPPPFELGPVGRIGVEAESQSSAFVSTLQLVMRQEKRRGMRLERLTSKRKEKKERIKSALQQLISDGQFVIRKDLYEREDNIGQELRTFDKGLDDCIDACSYVAEMCRYGEELDFPLVNIACDPAFTEEEHSNYTAIVAGCWFRNQFWVLECLKFQTDRADYIARMLFSMYDRFQDLAFKQDRVHNKHKAGFSSEGAIRRNTKNSWHNQNGWVAGNSLEIALPTSSGGERRDSTWHLNRLNKVNR